MLVRRRKTHHIQTTKIFYHILDKLKEARRREIREQCMQTLLAQHITLALTLFIATTFAKQLCVTVLCTTALFGILSAHCTARIHWVPSIVPPKLEHLRGPCKPALPSLPLAEFLQSESLGSMRSSWGHLNLSDPLMKFLKGLHKSSSLKIA